MENVSLIGLQVMKTIYTCSNCGGTDVEIKAWVNPNDAKIFDHISYDQEDCWCNDCEEHYDINSQQVE